MATTKRPGRGKPKASVTDIGRARRRKTAGKDPRSGEEAASKSPREGATPGNDRGKLRIPPIEYVDGRLGTPTMKPVKLPGSQIKRDFISVTITVPATQKRRSVLFTRTTQGGSMATTKLTITVPATQKLWDGFKRAAGQLVTGKHEPSMPQLPLEPGDAKMGDKAQEKLPLGDGKDGK